jgi:outer membrane biosynthesis protein TonB
MPPSDHRIARFALSLVMLALLLGVVYLVALKPAGRRGQPSPHNSAVVRTGPQANAPRLVATALPTSTAAASVATEAPAVPAVTPTLTPTAPATETPPATQPSASPEPEPASAPAEEAEAPPAPTPPPVPVARPAPRPAVTARAVQSASLRTGPSTDNLITGFVPAGTRVTVVGCAAGCSWLLVTTPNGGTAWSASFFWAVSGTP